MNQWDAILWNYMALGVTVLLTVVGQLLIKKGSAMVRLDMGWWQAGLSLLNRYIVPGMLCALVAPLFYFFALTKIPLSIAFAFNGLNYVFVFIGGNYFFKERVNGIHVAGIVLIFVGVVVFNMDF